LGPDEPQNKIQRQKSPLNGKFIGRLFLVRRLSFVRKQKSPRSYWEILIVSSFQPKYHHPRMFKSTVPNHGKLRGIKAAAKTKQREKEEASKNFTLK
jgi:hypothetical protein